MKPRSPSFRRNFVVASVAHLTLISGLAVWQGIVAPWQKTDAVEVELIPPDLFGDMPVGEGTGRGAYTPPKLGAATEQASFSQPNEATFTPEERPAPAPTRRSEPKVDAGEVAVPKKTVKKVVEKKSTSSSTSRSASTRPAVAKVAKGSPTGSPTGESATDIRNRFAKALRAEAGGTAYGDGRKAGGGEGKSSVIGSRDGSPDGIAGGVGKGTKFWWYYQHVHDKMYAAWSQPPESVNWDKRQFSTVVIKVARDGEVVSVRLQTPSGNSAMDQSALDAARSVEKLQPLPDGLGGATTDISINFQLEG